MSLSPRDVAEWLLGIEAMACSLPPQPVQVGCAVLRTSRAHSRHSKYRWHARLFLFSRHPGSLFPMNLESARRVLFALSSRVGAADWFKRFGGVLDESLERFHYAAAKLGVIWHA